MIESLFEFLSLKNLGNEASDGDKNDKAYNAKLEVKRKCEIFAKAFKYNIDSINHLYQVLELSEESVESIIYFIKDYLKAKNH